MSKKVPEIFLFDIYISILKIERTIGEYSNPESLFLNYYGMG